MSDTILCELYSAMGVLVLQSNDRGEFTILADPPAWFKNFDAMAAVGACVRPIELFPFLEIFLPEAEVAWNSPAIRRSECWTEIDSHQNECHLAATAVRLASQNILLVSQIDADFQERQKLLQIARESRLKFDRDATAGERERDRLSNANRAKSQFLADLSHELRSPLSSILGFSELLQEQAGDNGDQPLVEDLQRIHAAGEHLLSLINEILDLSKLEAGKMRLHVEEFAVSQVIQDVIDMMTPAAAKNGNALRVKLDPNAGLMQTDLLKLRQCLLNVVGNAAKFTRNGTVTLSTTRLGVEGNSSLQFAVCDTGIGITPAQLAKLFQPFAQADSSIQGKFGGSGLGLAISRQYCRLMGGDITIESQPGVGSTFTILLPAIIRDEDINS